MEIKSVSDYIHEVAEVLEKEGWTQQHMVTPEGRCLVGGYSEVWQRANGNVGILHIMGNASTYITREILKHPDTLRLPQEERGWWGKWNDLPWRKKQEVLDLLRLAEKNARYDEDFVAHGKEMADQLKEGRGNAL